MPQGSQVMGREERKCMANKGCLIMQIRVSQGIRVVSGISSLTDMETSLYGNFLYKYKFPLQKEKFTLYF